MEIQHRELSGLEKFRLELQEAYDISESSLNFELWLCNKLAHRDDIISLYSNKIHLQGKEIDQLNYDNETVKNQLINREERLKSAIEDGNDLLKSNQAKDETIERLEGELSEAVEIMGAIYDNVDKYHLDFAFSGGECYDKLKDYLGV